MPFYFPTLWNMFLKLTCGLRAENYFRSVQIGPNYGVDNCPGWHQVGTRSWTDWLEVALIQGWSEDTENKIASHDMAMITITTV